jgi:hypothetical protein
MDTQSPCRWPVFKRSSLAAFDRSVTRFDDTRDVALEYINKNVVADQCIGLSVSSEQYGWQEHSWRYPRVNLERFREQPLLGRPRWLVLSSYDFEPIEEALRSPQLRPGYVWDKEYDDQWYLASPPSPQLFSFYDELLNTRGGDYDLVADFRPRIYAPIEFAPPEIRIYQRQRKAQPVITKLFPAEVKVATAFNLQPSGLSAIAVQGSGFECGDGIFWNGDRLETTLASSELLTAFVPPDKISHAGQVVLTVESPQDHSIARATLWVR